MLLDKYARKITAAHHRQNASKDDEVVEFALSRSLSPTMVAEYNLKLIDKKLLQKKLKEYIELAKLTEDENA